MVKVAINGFGRIGRMVLKAGINDKKLEFVAVNDLTDTKTLAHLFKYDSAHGKFNGTVEAKGDFLIINGKKIKVTAEKEPEKLPWKELKVDVVVESTGRFRTQEDVEKHMKAGAKKVLLSAPPKGENKIKIVVHGVNDSSIDKKKDMIISNASCTTNCLAPMVKVLNDKFGIEKGFLTTVHSYTGDQRLVDAPHSDIRRGRSAAMNIIPTTTGAAKAVTSVIPALKGKLDGIAIRVPTVNCSVSDFVCTFKKNASVEDINKAMKDASKGSMKGVIEYSEEPLVSTDIMTNPASCIFDSQMTHVIDGKFVKIIGWYDNEWGYSCRMIDMIKKMF